MNTLMESFLQGLGYSLPALVVAGISYYFFEIQYKNEKNRRHFLLLKENQKNALPLRLQAYERITLFLDRINPQKLLMRVPPTGKEKQAYESLLIHQIDSEFDHNITQQIYLSEDCWNVVKSAKNATIQIIRKASINPEVEDAQQMREVILSQFINKPTPSNNAMSHLMNEVQTFLQ